MKNWVILEIFKKIKMITPVLLYKEVHMEEYFIEHLCRQIYKSTGHISIMVFVISEVLEIRCNCKVVNNPTPHTPVGVDAQFVESDS